MALLPPHPLSLLITLSLLLTSSATTKSTNLTAVLSPHPSLSSFSALLTTASLSSVTIPTPFSLLAVPNNLLLFPPPFPPSSTSLSDLLRHHLILSPFPSSPLSSSLPLSLPTLLSSTGRYPPSSSSVTLSLNPLSNNLTLDHGSANVISVAYGPDVTVVVIDSFLVPYEVPADTDMDGGGYVPTTNTAGDVGTNEYPVNITKALADSHGFNVFASILSASGLVDEFHRDESGAGLTIFIPTDAAFANIPPTADFQSLTAEQKAEVLRFHCIRSYYPLGSLQAIVNPLQPTLATEVMGAGKYTLNITGVNGSVVLDTGIVQSTVDQTVFDENPVAIFGVPVVFLPKEIFGGDKVVSSKRGEDVVEAPSPEVYNAPHSPVGEVKSVAVGGRNFGLDVVCIALLYLLV